MNKIYTWLCYVCDRKGATNIAPRSELDLICMKCGNKMHLETFTDVFERLHK